MAKVPQNDHVEAGEKQAENLAPWLSNQGYPAINLVITKYPGGTIPKAPADKSSPTPNPFDTVYPYLKKNPTELYLIDPGNYHEQIIDPGLETMIDSGSLYPSDGSTLLCWDAEGLWGEKVGKDRPYDKKSILAKVSTHYLGDADVIKDFSPGKGKTVFIFTDGHVKIYNFVNGSFEGPIFEK